MGTEAGNEEREGGREEGGVVGVQRTEGEAGRRHQREREEGKAEHGVKDGKESKEERETKSREQKDNTHSFRVPRSPAKRTSLGEAAARASELCSPPLHGSAGTDKHTGREIETERD